ncbi:uncharacterized protein BDW43DRAFT_314267 [Aspergillus alliaceus]|uniref:uncharacterized protein n=1 Tax=Petromyces alliaceus TaxID=209559 RepID=UPI0012A6A4D4|nr:uncharacterized protein BDW43DRAFT_314267 [Aspergillus alliaceus]KAB8230213.1 hypothetical protein BDW43DRAFT_314267 [Aspergillus alliaceus]
MLTEFELCFDSLTRPLTVNELIEAHAVDLGASPHLDGGQLSEQVNIIDICLGLVEIEEKGDKTEQNTSIARIALFSVQKYLQTERTQLQKAKYFAIHSGPADA